MSAWPDWFELKSMDQLEKEAQDRDRVEMLREAEAKKNFDKAVDDRLIRLEALQMAVKATASIGSENNITYTNILTTAQAFERYLRGK
jgi:hypothetical protein